MTITLEQYNMVLDGLRTQLELQRAFNAEITFSRDRFKEAYSINLKQSDKVVKDFQQEMLEQAKQIEQLKSENFNLSKELTFITQAHNTISVKYDELNNAHIMTLEEHGEVVIALKVELDTLKKSYADLSREFPSDD